MSPSSGRKRGTGTWQAACHVGEVPEEGGAAAWLDGAQVALFRVRGEVYAIGNRDPVSGSQVLARGIVGELNGELVVASPLHKQHFSLRTGRCLEEPQLYVPTYEVRLEAGWIWLHCLPDAVHVPPVRRERRRRRLLVVGNGMAATRTLEELLRLAPDAFDITVFAAEPHDSYNRILLSAVLAGDRSAEEIVTHPSDWYEQHGIELHRADPVVQIDRRRRVVRSQAGAEVPYDRLLLATGSQTVTLPVPGHELPGVVGFRDLRDVEAMLQGVRPGSPAVVIGGGLLGLEAAYGLARRGMQVTVVHLMPHLMERQLDASAAALLQRELQGRGLQFRLRSSVVRICGETRACGVEMDDGTRLPAELIVTAVGVRPDVSLARGAGIRCKRGILVDDTLLTFDPAIYAVGECVEHRGQTFGLVAPVWEQARICALHLAGNGATAYRRGESPSQLKVRGVDLFSAGNCNEGAGTESLVLHDAQRGVYRKLVLAQDRLQGAVLYGDVHDAQRYLELINSQEDVSGLREHLLFVAAAQEAAGA